MIIDYLKNWARYEPFSAELAMALKYAYETDLLEQPAGKITLQYDEVFMNRMSIVTRCSTDAKAENHLQYLDIHCPLSESESIEVTLSPEIAAVTAYDEANDFELYDIQGPAFPVQPGQFLILFPGEVHKPCIGEPEKRLEKAVIKFHISLLTYNS